jgi:glycerol uptake facilitator protein
VTVGLVIAGKFAWPLAPGYIAAQMAGGFCGAVLVYLCYKEHYDVTEDVDGKLATFCTAPNIRSLPRNVLCEAVGTFILIAAVLLAVDPTFQLPGMSDTEKVKVGLGSLGALPVGLVVFSIGLSLGGTTGYAINPARDLAPRIAHAILPMRGKRDSDWSYAAVPALAPILGAILAALAFNSV